jgi:hypothetical protein
MKDQNLLTLVDRLKACPAYDTNISEKALLETWTCFRQMDLEHGDDLTPAIMAALILHDNEVFAELLNEEQFSLLLALAKTAFERYQQITNPPNKLGKLLVGIIKEEPE